MTSTAIAPSPEPQTPVAVAETEATITRDELEKMLAARKQRHDGWTPIKVAAFIEALSETCSVRKAADYVGISPAAAYQLRQHPEAAAFREAWDNALSMRFEELTDIAMDRVRNGVEKNRWWHDQLVGVDTVFSDRLLIHMLKRSDPDRTAARPAGPQATALPFGKDFMIAAAVQFGRLGWHPEDDNAEEYDDADLAAMAAQQARGEAAEAAYLASRARIDALPKCSPEQARLAALGTARARLAGGEPGDGEADRIVAEEAALDRRYAELARVLSLKSLDRVPAQRKKSRQAASVSAGASSGRK